MIFGGAIAALKDKGSEYSFDFHSLLISAETKEDAQSIAGKICLEQFPKKDGYTSHRVSVTNAITEVKA